MTDNEIIKALECCGDQDNIDACDDCPCLKGKCISTTPYILDLINRQKAEIERLNRILHTDVVVFRGGRGNGKSETIKKIIEVRVDAIRAAAVKEFAERYERYLLSQLTTAPLDKKEWINFCLDELDNLKKEMAGDTE